MPRAAPKLKWKEKSNSQFRDDPNSIPCAAGSLPLHSVGDIETSAPIQEASQPGESTEAAAYPSMTGSREAARHGRRRRSRPASTQSMPERVSAGLRGRAGMGRQIGVSGELGRGAGKKRKRIGASPLATTSLSRSLSTIRRCGRRREATEEGSLLRRPE